jgi:hypothetical protein
MLAPGSWGVAGAADAQPRGTARVSGTTQVSDGPLSRQLIDRAVQAHFPAFRTCYEQTPEPRYVTSIDMHFVIAKDGHVQSGHIDAEGNDLGACAEPILRGMTFPLPAGGPVTVAYGVEFAPGPGELVGHGPGSETRSKGSQRRATSSRGHSPGRKGQLSRVPPVL